VAQAPELRHWLAPHQPSTAMLQRINAEHFSSYLPPSEVKTAIASSKSRQGFIFWVLWKPTNLFEQKTRGGNPCTARDFSANRGHSCRLGEKRNKNRTNSHENYVNSRLLSSSGFVGSAASGVKSDDKCAPASNIKPEINAQNIRATEIEKAWPYTS
jgi:hypothetical protein